MKTIIAFSDSHNYPLPERLLSVIDESDYVFFLGDGSALLGDLVFHSGFYGVSGNCDANYLCEEQVVDVEGLKILLTHGDKYNVKENLLKLRLRAEELKCDVVFYGHTHYAEIDRIDNITYVCPGSIANSLNGSPTYVYANVINGKFLAKIVNMA